MLWCVQPRAGGRCRRIRYVLSRLRREERVLPEPHPRAQRTVVLGGRLGPRQVAVVPRSVLHGGPQGRRPCRPEPDVPEVARGRDGRAVQPASVHGLPAGAPRTRPGNVLPAAHGRQPGGTPGVPVAGEPVHVHGRRAARGVRRR